MEILVLFAWAAMFSGPLLGVILGMVWHAERGPDRRRACISAGVLIITVSVSWRIGLQTSSLFANFVFCVAAFHAYWVLAAAAWSVKPRPFGVTLGFVAWLPVVPVLLSGTVGALGLVFIVGDFVQPPRETRWLTPSLSCEVTSWGYAFSAEGYNVRLYRSLSWFPVIRINTRTVVVNETNSSPGVPLPSCASVAAEQ